MIGVARELDSFSTQIYLREPGKSEDKAKRRIILFSKGCPNPSCPICAAAAAATRAQATAALARRYPPCQGAVTPTTGATILAGGRASHGRQPLAGTLGSPLRVPYSRPPLLAPRYKRVCLREAAAPMGCCPRERRRPPLQAGLGRNRPPPCRGPWSEIVYPCIPDPDGEDEGSQASSSLAVSTRWISTEKLLQSDLATLA
ncbi:hypothetical protein B296_00012190 [Ensete ventricosum]|uniref:Uncharacterized protein n=1 Tax=Ensete ventricosum TaxID=4639 RepID=A0A426Y8Q0_ENSVE|nr:hypothetical protein B296_00012190 [Ensete ventricosum]